MCRSKKIKQMIWGTDKSAKIVQLKDLNAYMQENSYPVFEPIRRQVRIQKGQSRIPYTPWNEKNMVFIPDGKLGIVKNAWANNELKQEAGVAYSNYGRIRVSQWGVGETQGSNGVEFTKAESLSLPVITEMNAVDNLTATRSLCNAIANTFYPDNATIEFALFNEGIDAKAEATPKDPMIFRVAARLVIGYVENSRPENGVSKPSNRAFRFGADIMASMRMRFFPTICA